MLRGHLPFWTWLSPLAGGLLLAASLLRVHPWFALALAAGLVACVLAAVHHAEVVALRVGEPFGTLVLALAVTVIEVALIVSLMLAGGDATASLARDTIFAAIMIILNGMVGLCLLAGGSRHGEQVFGLYGVNAALATLSAMAVIALVLPNTTTTTAGPIYSTSQLALIAVVILVLYAAFVLVQAVQEKFGGDTMDDVRTSVERYRERIANVPEARVAAAARHGLVGSDEASSGGDD